MKKRSFVFSLAVFILFVCGLAYGDKKKNIPTSTSAQQAAQQTAQQAMVVDIAIDDIFVDSQCRVWVRWINKGTVKIDKLLRETVFADGNPAQRTDLFQVVLQPGAVFAHGVGPDPGLKVSGAAIVHAAIDADNVLKEKNEENNFVVKTLPCGKALPDLMPTYISCHTLQNYVDAQHHGCKVFEVSITIKNFGNRDITTPFKVHAERDSGANLSYVPFVTYDVPALAAGASLTFAQKPQADTGWWYLGNPGLTQVSPRIRVTVDSGNSVVESLENNNQTVHVCTL